MVFSERFRFAQHLRAGFGRRKCRRSVANDARTNDRRRRRNAPGPKTSFQSGMGGASAFKSPMGLEKRRPGINCDDEEKRIISLIIN